ncbi:hypothetical protein B0T17DRAFT_220924 [Bombardia bombarda]|uniref:Ankyrin repeat protein n=1 Tax=Bombardia bombarda TaxID=252184 RepID=A0AA39XAN6_9PEZI|nr:hypothetical protein B0T17DRAFT_220924 [Bombardia bombarda]
MVRLLLHHGADASLATSDCWSPLEMVHDCPELLELIIQHLNDGGSANVSLASDSTRHLMDSRCAKWEMGTVTALFLAAMNNHVESARLLIKAGANVNFVRKASWDFYSALMDFTPIVAAAYNGHTEMVKLLLRAGGKTAPGWKPQSAEEQLACELIGKAESEISEEGATAETTSQ